MNTIFAVLFVGIMLPVILIFAVDILDVINFQRKIQETADNAAAAAAMQAKIHYEYDEDGELIDEYLRINVRDADTVGNLIIDRSLKGFPLFTVEKKVIVDNSREERIIESIKGDFKVKEPSVDVRIQIYYKSRILKKYMILSAISVREGQE